MGRYRKPEYYDKIFRLEKYNCHYSDSVYYHANMWQKVISYISYPDVILEIGCGTGQFAEMLLDKGKYGAYFGIDFSPVAVKKSIKRLGGGGGFGIWDARIKIPIGWFDSYNTAICLQTLEHIDNDILVLENIKSGTKFIGSVPMGNDPAHVRVFKTPESITKRYGKLIDIEEIIEFDIKKFVFKGIIK